MNENNTICPVMKNPVDTDLAMAAGLTGEHDGKVFYFCCPPCQTKFADDPEQYLAGLPEEPPTTKQGCSCC